LQPLQMPRWRNW